jgi:hypothetical protein
MGLTPGGIAGQSYNISEMIANGTLFFLLTEKNSETISSLPIDIKRLFYVMAFRLSQQIEYCGVLTGNHTINNARALYFFGEAFNKIEYINIAEEIFLIQFPELITKKGFLREGSSHYQLLFTRWLYEILWVSNKFGNTIINDLVSPYYRSMHESCNFFYINNTNNGSTTIPLIGDISPDFPPEWLINTSFDKNTSNYSWKNLWSKDDHFVDGNYETISSQKSDLQYDEESGWFKIINKTAKLFLHIDPKINSSFGNHRHNDSLSFVLYLNDEAILIDTGRLNYLKKNKYSKYGLMAHGHNSLILDGLEPILHIDRNLYPDYYKETDVFTKWTKKNDEISFSISHNGFERLFGDNVKHQRVFTLTENNLIINDKFFGKKEHDVEWFFHFAPNVELLMQNNSIVSGKTDNLQFSITKSSNLDKYCNYKIFKGQEEPNVNGWCVHSYGQLLETNNLVYNCKLKFPLETSYTISWDS